MICNQSSYLCVVCKVFTLPSPEITEGAMANGGIRTKDSPEYGRSCSHEVCGAVDLI